MCGSDPQQSPIEENNSNDRMFNIQNILDFLNKESTHQRIFIF